MLPLLSRILVTIFTVYTCSVPLARLAMLESSFTIFGSALSLISIFMSITVYTFSISPVASLMISILAGIISIAQFIVEIHGPIPDKVDMRGKVILVTGANSGIGVETTRQFMQMGANVIMGCRSIERSKPVQDELNKSVSHLPHSATSLDLCSLTSVRKYVEALTKEGHTALDALVCNAGLMPSGPGSHIEITPSGRSVEIENCFASNHLGHHLLIKLLLPSLRASYIQRQNGQHTTISNTVDNSHETDTLISSSSSSSASSDISNLHWSSSSPSRIIIVSSSIHKIATTTDANKQFLDPKNYSIFPVYGASKLSTMLCAKYLEYEICNNPSMMSLYKDCIHINTLHPGNPVTSVTQSLPRILQILEYMFYPLMFLWRETCTVGAYCTVWATTHPDVLHYGQNQYFIHLKPAKQHEDIYNYQCTKDAHDYTESLLV